MTMFPPLMIITMYLRPPYLPQDSGRRTMIANPQKKKKDRLQGGGALAPRAAKPAPRLGKVGFE